MGSKLRIFTATLFFLIANIVTAQQILQEISMKPGYSDQVYVSLEKGAVKSVALAEWDLGFEIKGRTSSIIVNEGKGWELYYVPGSTQESFSLPLDEGDIAQWERVINSPLSWSSGAFNRNMDANLGTYGWGEYDPSTHAVKGNAVYVMKLVGTMTKKIMITALVGGKYMFKYANLDGTEEKSGEVAKSDFDGRNFGYYSFTTGDVVDHEPDDNQWDMVFGKYVDYAQDPSGNEVPYSVTGIRTNGSVTVAKVPNGAASNSMPDISAFSTNINTIGYNWKSFTGGAWILDTTTAYYVKNQNNKIYKIVFKSFGGNATGTTTFMQQDVTATSLANNDISENQSVVIFPSILQSGNSFSLQLQSKKDVVSVSIIDYTGKTLFSTILTSVDTLHTITLPSLPIGQYGVMIHDGIHTNVKKIFIYQ